MRKVNIELNWKPNWNCSSFTRISSSSQALFLESTFGDPFYPIFFNLRYLALGPLLPFLSSPFFPTISSLQAICMHRCFIKGSFRRQRRQLRRWQPRLWRWKEKPTSLLSNPGIDFPCIFRIDSPYDGEKMRWLSLGFEERGQKRIERREQGGRICNDGRSRPFATLSSSPQPRKTYRWNKTALRRCRVWFRCDIILPPSSTTSFSYNFSSAFLNPCAPHPLLRLSMVLHLWITTRTTGELAVGRRTYDEFPKRERKGEKEKRSGWRRSTTETFSSAGFAGKTR